MELDPLERPSPGRPAPLPVQDLEVYERWGGHTLRRHVGTPPGDELRRIREEDVAGAGSFLSRAMAQRCVGTTINARRDDVVAWLGGPDRHAPLVLTQDMGQTVGRSLTVADVNRGVTIPRHVSGVLVVLRREPELPGGFLVKTAYPTRLRRTRGGIQGRRQ